MVDAAVRRAFTSLVAAACTDGRLSSGERALLLDKATALEIPTREFEEFLREGQQGKLTVAVPTTNEEKQRLLTELIDVVCSDGRVESQEKQILLRFAHHVGVDAGDLGVRVRERMNRRRNEAPRPQAPKARSRPVDERVLILDDMRSPEAPPQQPRPQNPPSASVVSQSPAIHVQTGEAAIPVRPYGPIRLGPTKLEAAGDLPPITRELVKNVVRFDGRDEAVSYVQRTCGITDMQEAGRIVDRLIAEDPDCKPKTLAVKRGG